MNSGLLIRRHKFSSNERIKAGNMVRCALSRNKHHKAGTVVPIYSIVGMLILHSKNLLGL